MSSDIQGHESGPTGQIERAAIAVGVLLRAVAVLVLAAGPWTNTDSELAGWDIDRFSQIDQISGRPWVDVPVEYPPGSVVLIKSLVSSELVRSHRLLVGLSLIVDLGIAALLGKHFGRRAAAAYLLVGLPLIPMGLLRFDLWMALTALWALIALRNQRPTSFGMSVAAGAAIKIMPMLMIPVALAAGRLRAAAASSIWGATLFVCWVSYAGLDAPGQVLSLRGATGWHVESLPGSLVALFGNADAQLEADAFRIGTMSSMLVLLGRSLFVAVLAAIATARYRAQENEPECDETLPNVVALNGIIAALLITAPLLSPQFMLWFTPFVAIAITQLGWRSPVTAPIIAAIAITGFTLAVFGPPNLAATAPATLLVLRNILLIFSIYASWSWLHAMSITRDQTSAED